MNRFFRIGLLGALLLPVVFTSKSAVAEAGGGLDVEIHVQLTKVYVDGIEQFPAPGHAVQFPLNGGDLYSGLRSEYEVRIVNNTLHALPFKKVKQVKWQHFDMSTGETPKESEGFGVGPMGEETVTIEIDFAASVATDGWVFFWSQVTPDLGWPMGVMKPAGVFFTPVFINTSTNGQ